MLRGTPRNSQYLDIDRELIYVLISSLYIDVRYVYIEGSRPDITSMKSFGDRRVGLLLRLRSRRWPQ